MGRNKIKIQKIANDRIRQVSYYKRRKGLIKKAMELSLLCDIEVFLTIVDKNNSLSVFSSKLLPSEFIQTYLQLPISPRDSYTLKDYKKLFEEEILGDSKNDANDDESSKKMMTIANTFLKPNGYGKGNNSSKENEIKNKNNSNVKANNGIIQIVLKDESLKNKKNNRKSNSKQKKKEEESKSEYEEEEYSQEGVSEIVEINNENHHNYNTRLNTKKPQILLQQEPIESGIINIKLNPPVVLDTEEVQELKQKNKDKQNGNKVNETYSELESNMLIINSALSISESDNNNNNENNNKNSKNKSTNNNTNSSNNGGLSKLKTKFGLKVNIQAAEEVNHINSKPTSNQSKSAFQSNNQQNETITNNNNSINSCSQINQCFHNTPNSNININVLSQKMSTNGHNMFSFRPEYEYDKQILSSSFQNPNFYPTLSHHQSHIQSPFVFESPNVLNNNSQMQINQQVLSTYNDFIKTMTPPVVNQPEGGYVNMLSNHYQFPYCNDTNANANNVNDNLNHKRYREDIMNTFTPLSQGRFPFNQNYVDNNAYYNRKQMPSLTPTPNSHVGFNFFGDDTNKTLMSTNELINMQPIITSTNGIANRNPITEGNNSESKMSPNKDNNCQLGGQKTTKLNK